MGRLTEKEVIEGFKIDNALLGENESGTVERNNIAIKCIEELQEYRSICKSPEKLKIIDELYLERCEEINRLKAELAEVRNKAIDEFAIEIKATLPIAVHRECSEIDYEVDCALYSKRNEIDRIAKRMKEVKDVN